MFNLENQVIFLADGYLKLKLKMDLAFITRELLLSRVIYFLVKKNDQTEFSNQMYIFVPTT